MTLVPHRIAVVLACVAALLGTLVVQAADSFAGTVPSPELISPANNSSNFVKDVVLTWGQVSGASLYQVRVSPNGEWTNNTVSLPRSGLTVNTVFDMPLSLPQATYYWEVRAQVGGNWSPYSKPWVFVEDWYRPITILQQPTTADPTIAWAPVKEASLYLLRFSTLNDFEPDQIPGEIDCYTNQTEFTIMDYLSSVTPPPGKPEGCGLTSFVSGTSYYWELVAFDDSTAPIMPADTTNDPAWQCSQPQPACNDAFYEGSAFTYQAPAPGPETGGQVTGLTTTWHSASLPGQGCTQSNPCPTTPTFSWNAYPGANYYMVHVYHDSAMSNTYQVYETCWPHVTPTNSIFDAQAGRSYYWRVDAGQQDGACSSPTTASTCPAADSTAKNPPTVTAATNNAGGQIKGGETVDITLTGTGFVSGSCVTASAGSVVKTTFNSPTQLTVTYTTPVGGGSITFVVTNPDGGQSAASPAITVSSSAEFVIFGRSALTPFNKKSGSVELDSPAAGATVHGTSPTFRWSDFQDTGGKGAFDARNYELQVSTDPDFSTTVLDDKDIDLTQFTDPASLLSDGSYYWRVAPIDESGNVLSWSATRRLTVNAVGPAFSLVTKNGVGVNHPLQIRVSERVSGVRTSTVRVVPLGEPARDAAPGRITLGASPTQYTFTPSAPLATGATYTLVLSPSLADANGNPAVVTGSGVRTATTAKNTSAGWQFSHGWSRTRASGALSGSYMSAGVGRSARLQVSGRSLTLYGCMGPGMGTLELGVGGHTHSVAERQSFTRCGVVLWHGGLPTGVEKITIQVTGGRANFDAVKVA